MKFAILILLLAPCAVASADAAKTWKKAQKAVDKAERVFWDEFKTRFNDAYRKFQEPVSEARDKPDVAANKEAVYDYAGIRALYTGYEEIQNGRGVADLEFAASGDPDAAATLLAELIADLKRMEKLAADLHDSKPDFGRYTFNQESGVRLFGMWVAHDNRIGALANAKGAVTYLTGEGWKRADKGDGRRSFLRRVAVIDALGAGNLG